MYEIVRKRDWISLSIGLYSCHRRQISRAPVAERCLALPPRSGEERMAPDPKPTLYSNRLLSRLSPGDLGLFEPRLERVEFRSHDQLEHPNQPIEHAFFPESGMASVVAIGNGDRRVEVGIVGPEGMTALMVVLGDDRSPHETMVQAPGVAMRLSAPD